MNKGTEIIEADKPDASPEKVIENQIKDQLVKYNVTDAVIANLKEKYTPLIEKGIINKEDYNDVKEARKECKGWRVTATKVCKEGREEATKVQKAWIKKSDEVVGQIEEIELPLQKLEEAWDAEQDRIKTEKKRKQEEQLATRQQELSRMGVLFYDGSFSLGDVSYDYALVKESDDATYSTMFNAFKTVFDGYEIERLAKEKEKQEADAELQRQKDELLRQQNELKEQQAEIQRQKEAQEKEVADKKKQEIRNRCIQLESLGMKFSFKDNAYIFEDVNVDNQTEICLFDTEKWDTLVEKIKPVIEQRKSEAAKQAEEKRLADIETAKQGAIMKEQQRQLEVTKQEEIKRQQEAAKKEEELAQASDKVKYADLLRQFSEVKLPDMRSGQYRKKVAIIREKLEEINTL